MLTPQQSATIGALFEMLHELGDGNWLILFSNLQKKANIRLKEQGEAPIKSGHQMGKVLTNLGLIARKGTNKGTALILTQAPRTGSRAPAHAQGRNARRATADGQLPTLQRKGCGFRGHLEGPVAEVSGQPGVNLVKMVNLNLRRCD